MRNILAKLPRLMQAKMKGLVQQIFLAPTDAAAVKRGRDLIAKFQDRYPAAMECLERPRGMRHPSALSRGPSATDPDN
jgi:transposase-like protein